MKIIKKNIKYLIGASILFLIFLDVNSSTAQTTTSSSSQSFFSGGNAPQYISVVYTWGSMVVGGLSLVVIAIAGINYMRSMGSPEVISQSKTMISGALIGLFLVLGGYVLLRTIDPRFVDLKITVPGGATLQTGNIVFCGDSEDFPSCTKDAECPHKCYYLYNYCIEGGITQTSTDDTRTDYVDIKCVNGKCGKAKDGFCGLASYGDSRDASVTCSYCDNSIYEYTFSHLCQSGTTCKKDDLQTFGSAVCDETDDRNKRPAWKTCQ